MANKQISNQQLWTGRIMSILVILFMLFDASIKFLKLPSVYQTTVTELGYPESQIIIHGISSLAGTLLYAVRRTSMLGAILLTAHLGGAVASNLRVDNPLFSNTLFPVYVGIFMWVGLWLRERSLRDLLPLSFRD